MPDSPNAPEEAADTIPQASDHDVGAASSFVPGEFKVIEAEGREIAICLIDDEFFAVNVRCTHAAWPMKDLPLDGCELTCVLHGARFDVRSGRPTAGPARRPLERFEVRVVEGRVEVAVPPRPLSPRKRTDSPSPS